MEEKIVYDYFYGEESEQFAFYRIPKQLIQDAHFKHLSTDAKLLYGMMLDRMSLSARNGWYDDEGRVYIYYPLEEIQEAMNCAHGKAVKLLAELDNGKDGTGLIERIKQGQGRPAIIYVKRFTTRAVPPPSSRLPKIGSQDFSKSEVQISENEKCRLPISGNADFRKSDGSNNNINNTYMSELETTTPTEALPVDRGRCKERICSNIEYDWLTIRIGRQGMAEVDELVGIMVDTVCSTKATVKIGGAEIPIADVRDRLLSLDASHIEYVLDCLKNTTVKIHNIHAYLLALLYRAPTTINHYYGAEVRHDQYGN